MKIIDLLNKIANGEQPKTIKYHDTIYNFEKYEGDWGYVNKKYGNYKWFANEIDCDLPNYLNDEIEIIEEDKKIEPIKFNKDGDIEYCDFFGIHHFNTNKRTRFMADKINEIIDHLNKGDK